MGTDLGREEMSLRSELRAWCRNKLASGSRPVPLHAALLIISQEIKEVYGISSEKDEIQ